VPKHLDAVKPLSEFRAPWETEDGSEAEINKVTLKKYIHNLITDKAKAQDARDETVEKLTKAETDLAEAKEAAATANGPEVQKQIDKLTKERDDLKAEVDKRDAEKAAADLRAEVLGDFTEKNPKAAKYVTGTTKEELEASLAEVKEDWGITDEDPDNEDPDDDEPVVRSRPRAGLRNLGDPENGKGGEQVVDFDKVAEQAIAGGRIF